MPTAFLAFYVGISGDIFRQFIGNSRLLLLLKCCNDTAAIRYSSFAHTYKHMYF